MAGYRVMAIILSLIFLGLAVGLFFHDHPKVVGVMTVIVKGEEIKAFVTSPDPRDMVVKRYLKYAVSASAFIFLGLALLFFISAINPMRMHPFIVVVMICGILWIPGSIWTGYHWEVAWAYWGGVAIFCLVLVILLATFFPRKETLPKPSEEPPSS